MLLFYIYSALPERKGKFIYLFTLLYLSEKVNLFFVYSALFERKDEVIYLFTYLRQQHRFA